MVELPVVDVGPLVGGTGSAGATCRAIDEACREWGFFYVVGHGVERELGERLRTASVRFFALADEDKQEIAMPVAGLAWRGWFPLGGELTSGVPDMKEGLYFGTELPPDHPHVEAGTPLHGANLFPRQVPELRTAVLEYMDALGTVARVVLSGVAGALGLDAGWFEKHLTADPVVLFRIFRYPPVPAGTATPAGRWGVGEHTDYGLLTLLDQDDTGGLQVHTPDGWVDADPLPDSFVCNIGDMLDRLTGGRYRSTPHRVNSPTGRDRLSFPFFFDPSWDAVVERLPIVERPADGAAAERWDHANVHGFTGTYGEYLTAKVAKVFPELAAGAG